LFTIVVLEETKYNTDRFVLQECGILIGDCLTLWRISGVGTHIVPDSEELVGVQNNCSTMLHFQKQCGAAQDWKQKEQIQEW